MMRRALIVAALAASCDVIAGDPEVDDVSRSLAPVVIVPGLTGSALEARLTHAPMPHAFCKHDSGGKWFNTWVRVAELLPEVKDCLVQRLQLFYNKTDDTYSNSQGVELRPVDFGGVKGIDVLDPGVSLTAEFMDMIRRFEDSLGYQVGKNLHGAPYDWRLAGDAHARRTNGVGGLYAQLQGLIEETVRRNGRRAVLISHSLGCPTTLYFFHKYVSEAWRAEFIEGWIALAGAWMGGSAQAACYLGGDTLGLPPWLISHDYVKRVQVTAASGVWLAPHPRAFGDRIILRTPSRNYTAADVPSLVELIGEQAGGMATRSLFDKLDLAEVQSAPANVRMQHWYSLGVSTREFFEFDKDVTPGFNEAPAKIHNGDGDGSVNAVSLLWPAQWAVPASAQVSSRAFQGVSHLGMLQDDAVLTGLVDYLHSVSGSADSTVLV
eukprot:TRINITY_DN14335_c0_g1_i1.p1 TRINITY_DN14335_c0_g1~~TRINITY_DN14335_c0_g1_i1.p1  ORF type:complete len:448 (+),score=71.88 TRINITY_DN14335_c0_g1_i1:38-1345(+)